MRMKALLFGAVVIGFLGLCAVTLLGPNSGGTLSRPTTRILSPLAADGLPNYAQAIVDIQREDVTAENNGAVLFWQAMGPADVTAEQYRLLCKELGVEPQEPPPYLVDVSSRGVTDRLSQWLAHHHESLGDAQTETTDATEEFDADAAAADSLDAISKSPWTTADFPPLAEWVAENEAPLDLLVAAAARPRFFSPPPNFLENQQSAVIDMLLPHVQGLRAAARSLAARAAFRAGNKQYVAAWQDCLACWRLGAHAARGPTLIERLVGIAVRGVAKDCTLTILQCDDLPESVARQILEDLNAQAPTIAMADALDQSERFMFLDYVLRQFTKRLGGLSGQYNVGEFGKVFSQAARVFAFDVDVPLRVGNGWYDRMVKAAGITDLRKRRQELDKISNDLQGLSSKVKAGMTGKLLFRKKRSEMIGDILVCLFLPAVDAAVDAEDRDATSLTLTRVAAALAVYRTQSGAYPESLDQMTPAILPTLPLDPYGAAPLHYERRGEGYVLYSVFQNGVDDGGRDFGGEIVGGEWLPADEKQDMSYESSDFVLRVPRPPLKVPVAPAAP